MKGNRKYKIILFITALLFAAVELFKPQPTNWTETLFSKDKIPYGTYVTEQVLPDLFPDSEVSINNETLYQILKLDSSSQNLLVIAKYFNPGMEDIEKLLATVKEGSNVLIFAESLAYSFEDTIGISVEYFFNQENIVNTGDTSIVNLFDKSYEVPGSFIKSNIVDSDSLVQKYGTIEGYSEPILVGKKFGDGTIYISTIPLLMSNYFLLAGENYKWLEDLFSEVPDQKITWTEYYQVGRLESQTPLRFILSEPALKWAWFILLISLVLFMIFKAKREQRAIPIVVPPGNSSVEFAETVGQLYLNQGDHKNILEKKVLYLKDHIYQNFYMHIHFLPEEIEPLAHKTGKSENEVKQLFFAINSALKLNVLTKEDLLRINKIIESFYPNKEA